MEYDVAVLGWIKENGSSAPNFSHVLKDVIALITKSFAKDYTDVTQQQTENCGLASVRCSEQHLSKDVPEDYAKVIAAIQSEQNILIQKREWKKEKQNFLQVIAENGKNIKIVIYKKKRLIHNMDSY